LRNLNFLESGKTCKYYDPKRKQPVEGTDMFINHGYETSVNFYERGLFLRMDLSHKVIRTNCCLDDIRCTYQKF